MRLTAIAFALRSALRSYRPLKEIERLATLEDPSAEERLFEHLKNSDPIVRNSAMRELQRRDPRRGPAFFLSVLDDGGERDADAPVGSLDAKKLLHFGLSHPPTRETTDAFIKGLKDEDVVTRMMSAVVLGTSGDPRAVMPLVASLTDSAAPVRAHAAESLGKLGDQRARQGLVAVAEADKDEDARQRARRALLRLG